MTREQAYDSLLNPLIAQVLEICKAHKIPMLASFGLEESDDEETEGLHCTSALLEDDWNPSPELLQAYRTIYSQRTSALTMITITKKPAT